MRRYSILCAVVTALIAGCVAPIIAAPVAVTPIDTQIGPFLVHVSNLTYRRPSGQISNTSADAIGGHLELVLLVQNQSDAPVSGRWCCATPPVRW